MKSFLQFVKSKYTPISGTQYGSNPGGLHTHNETGKTHYLKQYADKDQGKVEALTAKIYEHMGIKTVSPRIEHDGGKEYVASEWNEHLKPMKPHQFNSLNSKQAEQIGRMYHAAVLTKNWDIIGLTHDNVLQHQHTGDIHAIDHGGAFHFRARGSSKNYGLDIDEHRSLRHNDQASGHVFSTVFHQHPTAELEGLKAVENIDDEHVRSLFSNSGLSNWKELHQNFNQRKKALLAKYER